MQLKMDAVLYFLSPQPAVYYLDLQGMATTST